MSQELSFIVPIVCITIIIFIFIWCCYTLKTGRLRMKPIKPINIYEPLTSSPYINSIIFSIIRCIVGAISLIILLYTILYLHQSSNPSILFYSYYIWSWILMIFYFISISFSKLCNCLSAKNNIFQTTLRIIIWIIYQLQLTLSLTLCIFLWFYLYFTSSPTNPFHQHLIHFPDITMVSCNFLFIWSDFFLNDIPLSFHYGFIIILLSWIYLFFVWILFIVTSGQTVIYHFLDPSKPINCIYYILWSFIHFISWTFVYYINYIKMKCQRRMHLEATENIKYDEDDALSNKQKQEIQSITIEPDGTVNIDRMEIIPEKHIQSINDKPHNLYLSAPDLMKPNPSLIFDLDDDDDDELSPLNGMENVGSDQTNHSVLTQRFVNLKQYLMKTNDDNNNNDNDIESISETDSFQTEYKDDEKESGHYLKITESLRVSKFNDNRKDTMSSMRAHCQSFHERINSVTILADVQDSIQQRKSTIDLCLNKKKQIEQELIDTERSYLDGLHVLLDEFITPIFEQKMIDSQYKKQIQCNIPQIISFHEQFLNELINNKPISAVFNKQSDYFKIYISYICEYKHILDIFAKFRKKNKKLKEYLNLKRSEHKPLTNHLILPIQRIPRYMLLLSELKKNTSQKIDDDYKDIECALEKITKICNEINEKQREIENMSQCLQITETLKCLNINIVEPQRKYIDHFIFQRKHDQRNRQFFIFNDMVIIANPKWEAKRVIKLIKFEAKKPNKNVNKEILINIIGDNGKNKNYQGPISYISTHDIPEKDKHENVSNIDIFCEIVQKYRDKLYLNEISRKHKISENEDIKISLELIEIIREKEDEDRLKQWELSSAKGDKIKVLTMLGSGESD